MKSFNVTIEIMPLKSVLDPQGEAIELSIKNNKKYKAKNFRVGKKIEFSIQSKNKSECKTTIKKLCKDFLVNEIIEQYQIKIEDAKN
ncbi:MAG TPA: phosphoribosylformylglycinamidine synthase subunit PurS [Candidatus Dadabacteria bacterium]|jgi:phosphoribosylformylglycinamidine synthase|nr:phosphoribosylformylglycinamidine synthase subunit PurS [Candidatus Dadabacteria bacterium]